MDAQIDQDHSDSPSSIGVYKESPYHLPIKVLLIAFVFALGVTVGVFGYQWYEGQGEVVDMPIETSLKPDSSSDIDDTADWQTYRNEEYGFEFKYPNYLTLEENRNPNDANNNYIVNLTDPTLSDPDCIYSYIYSCPSYQILIQIGKIVGNFQPSNGYEEITNNAGIVFYKYSGKANRMEWFSLRTVNQGYLYTIMPVRGENTETSENEEKIQEHLKDFDQILSTFRFLDGE